MGYFGSIAKQSGLRVGGAKKGARPSEVLPARRRPEPPPEREEVVMISRETNPRPAGQNQKPADSRNFTPSPVSENVITPSETPIEKLPFEADPAVAKPFQNESVETVSEKPDQIPAPILLESSPKSAPEAYSEPEIIEKVVTGEPVFSAVSEKEESAPPVIKTPEDAPKNHFEKTSEILAGRRAEPAEVQTILLREIQEWIAAGPEPEVDPVTREVLLNDEPLRFFKSPEKDEPEPGVIRIGEAPRERKAENAKPENAAIEEQSFELSIGTISVTIEGDAGPQQSTAIVQKPTSSPENKSDDRPRGSRLSRHYI